jgi:hypothetical protein
LTGDTSEDFDLFKKTEVIIVKDLLYAVVGLAAAAVAVWQIWEFVSQKAPRGGETANYNHVIIGVICAVIALICGGLFLSGRVNREEEIHITE